MADYGLTPNGPVKKRLDTILDELHDDLSEKWDVNTRLNPHSYFNVQLTAFADKIAELWEVWENTYWAMYPYSAENSDLDNAVQYGGIKREQAAFTVYPIHCTCLDGTEITRGTILRSTTNPTHDFTASQDFTVTRNNFNSVRVIVISVQPEALYTVVLNGTIYNFTSPAEATEELILKGLKGEITDNRFNVVHQDNVLEISAMDIDSSNTLILGSSLTTEVVTSVVNFRSEEIGEIIIPQGIITQIVTSIPGFLAAVNNIPHIAGRLRETDPELRRSYADKIYLRSSNMVESIECFL